MNKFHGGSLIYPVNLGIKVMDMDRMVSFYSEALGFELIQKENEKAVLGVDGRIILTLTRPENVVHKPPRRAGLYHFAILLPNRKELGSLINHIRKMDIPVTGGANHKVSEALYLQDPEDNGIEIYADVEASKWSWDGDRVQMGTDPLDYRGLMELGKDSAWKGMPQGTRLGHMHLHVGNLKKAFSFYSALGFEMVAELGGSANFISTGGYHHHMGLNTWNGPEAKPAPDDANGLEYFTLAVPDLESLEQIREKLIREGYESELKGQVLYTQDPSGNKIQLRVV